ncbi:MAG: hypothetical protein HQL28_00090 [Candidatus Omnitrophica bacterium]|nr:hypothetical protein [Candidatus Omnitrophota bacterium]
MIRIDLSVLIFIYLFLSVIALLVLWIFYDLGTKLKSFSSDEKHVWYCHICGNTYVDSMNDEISKCPKCSSYIEKKSGEIK